ncbi:double-headed protease inhibitor, submandibular gland-like isoform X2 [Hyla sarda]|uniref:double-headed protease inhibitor, submandibular gland-like isoform X2 n=1 Tax=Hyla sarda TaxID=327740 RepID=UPI0024C2945F|nr:double-headed protease inhibitor, submandibular gland-like isoform X2 [Hyla sarda]
MTPIGVIVLAVVAFISFTGVICNPIDGGTEDECQDYQRDACFFLYLPVCGSDGVNYGNLCEFCHAKRSDPQLWLVSKEACLKTNK